MAAAGRLAAGGEAPADIVVAAAAAAVAVGIAAVACVTPVFAACAVEAAFCRLSTRLSMLANSMGVSAVPSQVELLDLMVIAWASEQALLLSCSHCEALAERS
jgi:hypothetical protein